MIYNILNIKYTIIFVPDLVNLTIYMTTLTYMLETTQVHDLGWHGLRLITE